MQTRLQESLNDQVYNLLSNMNVRQHIRMNYNDPNRLLTANAVTYANYDDIMPEIIRANTHELQRNFNAIQNHGSFWVNQNNQRLLGETEVILDIIGEGLNNHIGLNQINLQNLPNQNMQANIAAIPQPQQPLQRPQGNFGPANTITSGRSI